jgi:hypothetical protein
MRGNSMLNLKAVLTSLVILATIRMVEATDPSSKETTPLDLKEKKVKRQEVAESQIGFTSTTVFYTLENDRIVVRLHIDNTKKDFPVTGRVSLFAKEVSVEDMAKWVNNQHSDGIFPDVPEPKTTVKLPAEACQSLESKMLGQKAVNGTTYNQYRVEIKLAEVKVNDQYRLKEFKDQVNVYVVVK